MAIGTVHAAIALLHTTAEHAGITIDQASVCYLDFEQARTTEQLSAAEKREAHNVYAPMIANLFSADPNAELNPAAVAQQLGMPDKQGARSFVRHQLKQLRLTHQAGGAKAAAD